MARGKLPARGWAAFGQETQGYQFPAALASCCRGERERGFHRCGQNGTSSVPPGQIKPPGPRVRLGRPRSHGRRSRPALRPPVRRTSAANRPNDQTPGDRQFSSVDGQPSGDRRFADASGYRRAWPARHQQISRRKPPAFCGFRQVPDRVSWRYLTAILQAYKSPERRTRAIRTRF